MSDHQPLDAPAFFNTLQAAFGGSLARWSGRPEGIDALLARAWDVFDGNLNQMCAGEPEPACRRGCASCCSLRVTATAPEVLLVARWLRALAPRLVERGIDLIGPVRQAAARWQGWDEARRVAAREPCPLLVRGVCLIHRVRPLACRGHASSDARACAQAAAGRILAVPASAGHRRLRSLVQNAMQSALREAGLAWGSFDLIGALAQVLDEPTAEGAWWGGGEPFGAHRVDHPVAEELAGLFDELAGRAAFKGGTAPAGST